MYNLCNKILKLVAVRLRMTYLTNVNFIHFRRNFSKYHELYQVGRGNLICKLKLLIYQEWGLATVIVLFM